MDDLYNMKLHDRIVIYIDGYATQIFRVPGGWIYRMHYYSGSKDNYNSTFVPYHNPGEFK